MIVRKGGKSSYYKKQGLGQLKYISEPYSAEVNRQPKPITPSISSTRYTPTVNVLSYTGRSFVKQTNTMETTEARANRHSTLGRHLREMRELLLWGD